MAELILTEAQSGERFGVRVGDAITIELPENAAAGYSWSASQLDSTRLELESQTHRQTRRGGGVGSAGTSVWRLRATSAGTTRLELKKSRPWESGVPAADVFAVDLDIVG